MPDLLIMDIMMPDIDGFDLLKKIRRISDVSVIMLSSKGETFDKVLALELGADDYIVKPFEPNELLARVKAILRRSHISNNNENIIVLPNLTINLSEYTVDFFNDNLEIPKKEFELLVFLVKNKNQVFTRNQILSKIWGYDYLGNSRTVDVHIKRLRGKLEYKNPLWEIKTVWGVGYKFEMK
jgi:DNA-binding response OmpR family regulator